MIHKFEYPADPSTHTLTGVDINITLPQSVQFTNKTLESRLKVL